MLIFLVGFMGSGKSFTGKALAKEMSFRFIDLDNYLEETEKRTIAEIFAEEGEDKFRELETQYLKEMAQFDKTIIATGGGTPCKVANLTWMKNNGLIIYLKASPSLLSKRLQHETSHRPLIAGMAAKDLSKFIENKLGERSKAYEAADVIIEQDLETDVVQLISKRLFGR